MKSPFQSYALMKFRPVAYLQWTGGVVCILVQKLPLTDPSEQHSDFHFLYQGFSFNDLLNKYQGVQTPMGRWAQPFQVYNIC